MSKTTPLETKEEAAQNIAKGLLITEVILSVMVLIILYVNQLIGLPIATILLSLFTLISGILSLLYIRTKAWLLYSIFVVNVILLSINMKVILAIIASFLEPWH